jgi:hypothetical protein
MIADRALDIGGAGSLQLLGRQVDDELDRLVGADLAHRREDIAVGVGIELLLVERRGIERIVELPDLVEAELDQDVFAAPAIGAHRMRHRRRAMLPARRHAQLTGRPSRARNRFLR